MIEGYWQECTREHTLSILTTIKAQCLEVLDPDRVVIYKSSYNVYRGFIPYKALFRTQWARNSANPQRKFLIPDGAHSFFFLADEATSSYSGRIFPLANNSSELYALNTIAGLALSKDSVVDYMALYGQIVQGDHGPFYFIVSAPQLGTTQKDNATAEALDAGLRTLVKAGEDGRFEIDVVQKDYFAIGRAFKLTIPTIYSEQLFNTDIRVSSTGVPWMDHDAPTTVEGLSDYLPPSPYYELDKPGTVAREMKRATSRNTRPVLMLAIPQFFEKVLGLWTMPTFALLIYIVLEFGFDDTVLAYFFHKLPESSVLNWLSLILGTAMILGSVVRFFVLESGRLIATFVPNTLTQIFDSIKRANQRARKKVGIILFVLLIFLEFAFVPFEAAVIMVYGIVNVFGISANFGFVEALIFVVRGIPGVDYVMTSLFHIDNSTGLYHVPHLPALSWSVSAFFGSVIFGVMLRIIALSRE